LVHPAAFSRSVRLRQLARAIAEEAGAPDAWRTELAAMLSQIGTVTLTPEIQEKLSKGRALSGPEGKWVEEHPKVGARLLRRIPRLEDVAAIVEAQRNPPGGPALTEPVSRAAETLRLALEFDAARERGMEREAAFRLVSTRQPAFPADLLGALERLEVGEPAEQVRSVRVSELAEGMILEEDLRTYRGAIVASRGMEVTELLRERLRSAPADEIVEPVQIRTLKRRRPRKDPSLG